MCHRDCSLPSLSPAVCTSYPRLLCMMVVQARGEALVLDQSAVNVEVLQGAVAVLAEMQTNPFFGAL